jgi:hypothetical protein
VSIAKVNAKLDSTSNGLTQAVSERDGTQNSVARTNTTMSQVSARLGVIDQAIQKIPLLRK